MAEDERRAEEASRNSPWAQMLHSAGMRLVPLLVSTGSLLGFIAFAGAVIVWTRLSAVEVPPDQAITAFPRGELVAIGASLLLLYGFFGGLAVLGAFLIDRGGRPTQGMAYGLLTLLLVEGLGAIAFAAGNWGSDKSAAVLLFAFPVVFAMWAISLGGLSELRDELHVRRMEVRPPHWTPGVLRPGGDPAVGVVGDAESERWSSAVNPSLGAGVAGIVVLGVLSAAGASDGLLLGAASVFLLALLGVVAFYLRREWERTRPRRREGRRGEEKETEALADREERWLRSRMQAPDREKWRQWREGEGQAVEDLRLARRRPYRLYLTGPGTAVVVVALLAAAVLPAGHLGELWLAASLVGAAVISMWLWRIAIFTREKVIWFGLAVFLALPLFGTLMTMARNIDNPQMQPLALIRNTDGPDEAIQGLYVTEAKDRVYFATVATDGCGGELTDNSGRLLWVPKEEVVAMSIGPVQGVEEAARTSLEMAFDLTPAVETPAGDSVSLTVGEERSERGGVGKPAPLRVQRLENVGPSVRPNFGRGLRLEPEDPGPGERVTLQMTAPVGEGFGATRAGRTIRVGGVPARIAINPTLDGARAEFVKTSEGERLELDREGLYVRGDAQRDDAGETEWEMVRFDPALHEGEPRFVRLAPDSEVVKPYTSAGDHPGTYLKLKRASGAGAGPGGRPEELAPARVTFKGSAKGERLDSRLWRQAWNKERVQFYVPEKATTGVVTVDCEQLAGQPLLRVSRAPTAKVSVRMRSGSGRVVFNSRHSKNHDGQKLARSWQIAGRRLGAKPKVAVELPPRTAPYAARLAVSNRDGHSDVVRLRLLRLPAARFGFDSDRLAGRGSLDRARRAVRAAIERERRRGGTPAVELHGHADDVGSGAYNVRLSRRRVENVRRALFPAEDDRDGRPKVPIVVQAFGESCPIDRRGGRRPLNRRVEVFVLGDGATVAPGKGCRTGHLRRTSW